MMPDQTKPFLTNLRPTSEVLGFPHPGRARVRRWTGETDDGILVDVYIAAVRVSAPDDSAAFEARFLPGLEELAPPMELGYQEPRGGSTNGG
jgi:hypothetical protein